MRELGFDAIENFYSVGEINLNQCPNFYKYLDALIFPSMLECFSATPIESMKMETPVFCSNYPFLSEICGNSAIYFDATSSDDIARVIHNNINNADILNNNVLRGLNIIEALPESEDRTLAYLKLMNDVG
ncbi:glycosyltransferase [Vibrio alginolyticus]|nr:glycosyltransferase [Vibrio alginolyticus]